MTREDLQNISFEIIANSGEARGLVHEAFAAMRKKEFDISEEKIEEANNALNRAHSAQTGLIQQYAQGEDIAMGVLLVHAQDHLMNTMTLREVAIELLHLNKTLCNKGG